MSLETLHPDLSGHKEIRTSDYLDLLPPEEQDPKGAFGSLKKEVKELGMLENARKFLNWSNSRLGCYVQNLYCKIMEKFPYSGNGAEREQLISDLDSVVSSRLAVKLIHGDVTRQNISQIYKNGALTQFSCARLIEEVSATPLRSIEKYEEREPNDILQMEAHRWLEDDTGKLARPDEAIVNWLKRHEDTQLGVDIWGYLEEENLYISIQVKSLNISSRNDNQERPVLLSLCTASQAKNALMEMKKYERNIDIYQDNKYSVLELAHIAKLYPGANILPALYLPTSSNSSSSLIKYKSGEPTEKLVQVFQRDLDKILYNK